MRAILEILFVIFIWLQMWLYSEHMKVKWFWYPLFSLCIMVWFIPMLFKRVGDKKKMIYASKHPTKKNYERKVTVEYWVCFNYITAIREAVIINRNLAHVNCLEAEKQTYNLVINIIDSHLRKLNLETSMVVLTKEQFDEKIKEAAWEAWKSAANAYRMYPDQKHTFSDYWASILK